MQNEKIDSVLLQEKLDAYCKEKDTERIERAFQDKQYVAAKYIFENSLVTEDEYNAIKEKYKPAQPKSPTYNELWKKVLDLVATKISSVSFDTWLNETNAQIKDHSLVVICRNSFQRDWVKEQYREIISSCLFEVSGENYELVFETEYEY